MSVVFSSFLLYLNSRSYVETLEGVIASLCAGFLQAGVEDLVVATPSLSVFLGPSSARLGLNNSVFLNLTSSQRALSFVVDYKLNPKAFFSSGSADIVSSVMYVSSGAAFQIEGEWGGQGSPVCVWYDESNATWAKGVCSTHSGTGVARTVCSCSRSGYVAVRLEPGCQSANSLLTT